MSMSMGMQEPECRKGLWIRIGALPAHRRRREVRLFSVRGSVNVVTTRRVIAAVAAALCLAGAITYWQGNQIGGGVLVRSGLVLGAIWVAWPALVNLNRRWLWPVLAALAFAVTRPALLIWLAPALLAFALLRHRGAK